jgi:D-arabinitol dehydrogenase (NADP+)
MLRHLQDYPYGFDVVVEATGVEKLANDAINYVRRGGTLMIYGVYENKALVHWPPSKIFGDEITVRVSPIKIHVCSHEGW